MIPDTIERFLARFGFDYTPVAHPAAFTAQQEAEAAHVPGKQWAKTVVYFAGHEPILAVVPAHYTVDPERLRLLSGVHELRLASEDEIVDLYPGCEPGAMPPFGPLYGQRVFVDRTLERNQNIVFEGGTHSDAIRMRFRDFDELVRPVIGRIGRMPGGEGGR